MNRNDLITLFEYNYWAKDIILATASKIEEAQLINSGMPSYETMLGTLTHVLNAECLWRIRCQEKVSPTSVIFENPFDSLAGLNEAWAKEQVHMLRYIRSLKDEQLYVPIHYRGLGGNEYKDLLWQTLTQLIYHGISHRSELAYRLTELGCSPGNLDFIIYLRDKI